MEHSFLRYLSELRDDMVEQFRGQLNIDIVLQALSKQLGDVYDFFQSLLVLRTLQNAEGKQLDGIGDIVGMTRTDALIISNLANQITPMDDSIYRIYLTWKIGVNTSNSTYSDVYNALKMFWRDSPLFYSEDPNYPATIFFNTPTLSPEDRLGVLLIAPMVKAAGVTLSIIANITYSSTDYQYGIISTTTRENYSDTEEIPTQSNDSHFGAVISKVREHYTDSPDLPTQSDDYQYSTVISKSRERFTDIPNLSTQAPDVQSGVIISNQKESYSDGLQQA